MMNLKLSEKSYFQKIFTLAFTLGIFSLSAPSAKAQAADPFGSFPANATVPAPTNTTQAAPAKKRVVASDSVADGDYDCTVNGQPNDVLSKGDFCRDDDGTLRVVTRTFDRGVLGTGMGKGSRESIGMVFRTPSKSDLKAYAKRHAGKRKGRGGSADGDDEDDDDTGGKGKRGRGGKTLADQSLDDLNAMKDFCGDIVNAVEDKSDLLDSKKAALKKAGDIKTLQAAIDSARSKVLKSETCRNKCIKLMVTKDSACILKDKSDLQAYLSQADYTKNKAMIDKFLSGQSSASADLAVILAQQGSSDADQNACKKLVGRIKGDEAVVEKIASDNVKYACEKDILDNGIDGCDEADDLKTAYDKYKAAVDLQHDVDLLAKGPKDDKGSTCKIKDIKDLKNKDDTWKACSGLDCLQVAEDSCGDILAKLEAKYRKNCPTCNGRGGGAGGNGSGGGGTCSYGQCNSISKTAQILGTTMPYANSILSSIFGFSIANRSIKACQEMDAARVAQAQAVGLPPSSPTCPLQGYGGGFSTGLGYGASLTNPYGIPGISGGISGYPYSGMGAYPSAYGGAGAYPYGYGGGLTNQLGSAQNSLYSSGLREQQLAVMTGALNYGSMSPSGIGGLYNQNSLYGGGLYAGGGIGGAYPSMYGGGIGGAYPSMYGGGIGGAYPSMYGGGIGGAYPSMYGSNLGGINAGINIGGYPLISAGVGASAYPAYNAYTPMIPYNSGYQQYAQPTVGATCNPNYGC